MLQYNQVKIDYRGDNSLTAVIHKVAQKLGVRPERLEDVRILKKSVDARKKPQIYYTYAVCFSCSAEEEILKKNRKDRNLQKYVQIPDLEEWIRNHPGREEERIIVVGTGPAGLFCGYFLARLGYCPVLIERGGAMEDRVECVERFWQEGVLDESTNVSFGEGGAGTFSDGKLNTGVNDRTGKKQFVLETFVRHGAPGEILYLAKPHIGTDRLRGVIRSMREEIEQLGGTYLFHSKVVELKMDSSGKKLKGVVCEDIEGRRQDISCERCVLAIGHSARDTFEKLKEQGIPMEQKPFAVGVRIEHPQRQIDAAQYGVEDDRLPAADYKLTGKTSDGRGVYSFCMCPGGYVVNASSEQGMTAVNGMSDHARDSGRANSAIVVTVGPEDFTGEDVLAGLEFQRELERKAYEAGKGAIPAQRFGDFKKGIVSAKMENESTSVEKMQTCTRGKIVAANVKNLLPSYLSNGIMEGMKQFGKKIAGFDSEDAVLFGTETRTSSPVRILRGENLMSQGAEGLYPCGEGAGYAGGIMSAAMDGVRVALEIAEERNRKNVEE